MKKFLALVTIITILLSLTSCEKGDTSNSNSNISETYNSSNVNSEDKQTITVYVTNTGKKYHVDGCQYLSRSQIEITLEEAKRNYTPCSKCHPPQ